MPTWITSFDESRPLMNRLAREIIRRLREVLGATAAPVPLHEPLFAGKEEVYVRECITTGWVSSVGAFVDRFEEELARFTGARRAVALVNGTCALQLALRLAGVRADDEVLVPALSFVATANAVAHLGAVPHFVDIEPATLGLDPDKLKEHLAAVVEMRAAGPFNRHTGRRLAAIVPMHAFGHPVRLPELLEVAAAYGLPVVEDAAESLGSTREGRHTGLWGQSGILSFNGNKVITTGGGGALLCQDETLARRAKHLSTTAKTPHPWRLAHDEAAYNFRMPNLNAALGCAQLEQLPGFLRRKRALAEAYQEAFADMEELRFVREPAGARSNYWLCVLALNPAAATSLEAILRAARADGLMLRPAWELLSTLPMYAGCPRADLGAAEEWQPRLCCLPGGPALQPPSPIPNAL